MANSYDFKSIKRALKKQRNFVPPYCSNPNCEQHTSPSTNFYIKYGFNKTQRFPYLQQKYKCKTCHRIFSYSFFFLDYYEHSWNLNHKIFMDNISGISNRCMGRRLAISEGLIRGRLQKLSRWAFLKHQHLRTQKSIAEALVYDGLENFSYSQYDPNNINHLVGKDSLFTYDFNFSPLNRKGRTSPRQKRIRDFLVSKHGRYPSDSIRIKTTELLRTNFKMLKEKEMDLYSDEHFQYRRSVNIDLKDLKINHVKISSKRTRCYKNLLFPINNFDMQIRQFESAFKRETISFSKNSIAMIDKFNLFFFFLNYMRAKFIKRHKRDPDCNNKSPAMYAGLAKHILSFDEYFDQRKTLKQVNLSPHIQNFFKRKDEYSRRKIVEYSGI